MQQTAGDGVLDGQHANHCWVLLHLTEHLLEGAAADELDLFTLEVQMSRNVVKRPDQSLYCYSLHLFILNIPFKKEPRLT